MPTGAARRYLFTHGLQADRPDHTGLWQEMMHKVWHGDQSQARRQRNARAREDKSMRAHLSESAIDKTLEDSFPASDPPAWY